jgi:hypothetical protein
MKKLQVLKSALVGGAISTLVIPGERVARGKGTQVGVRHTMPPIGSCSSRTHSLNDLGPLPSRYALAGDDTFFVKRDWNVFFTVRAILQQVKQPNGLQDFNAA